ncbi:MAG: toprim domain-containing protein, partial [Patescibacteria group bacterium]
MHLVIVESPTKARTIGKFLGKDFVIKASMGHVMDLPKSKLSVDVDHDFKPLYEIMPDKKAIIADLKKSAKTADLIILATDPDREGEAIASHIAETLGYKDTKIIGDGKKKKTKKDENLTSQYPNIPISRFQRIAFHEITKEAIEEALLNPGIVNKNLVNAQTARRVLDRLVGYKLSPLLWQKVRRGLSAGRVQSVALRLIVERER